MMTSNGARVSRQGPASDANIDQLLHPSRFYARPADVVADRLLTVEERRAILSSWASDACAVESDPTLRQPPHTTAPVTFDEIMDALCRLDRLDKRRPTADSTNPTFLRTRRLNQQLSRGEENPSWRFNLRRSF